MTHSTILAEIEAFIERHGMAESTFGREALNDWSLISKLRGENGKRPRRLFAETEKTIRDFMEGYVPPVKGDVVAKADAA